MIRSVFPEKKFPEKRIFKMLPVTMPVTWVIID